MAKKQVVSTITASAAAPARAAAKAPAKTAAKAPEKAPVKTRTTAAKHSKAVVAEVVVPEVVVPEVVAAEVVVPEVVATAPVAVAAPVAVVENAHEAISKIAYGYWVARGYASGNPVEDWVRAEREYLGK